MIIPENANNSTPAFIAPPEYSLHAGPSTSHYGNSTYKDPLKFGGCSVTAEGLDSTAFVTEDGRIDVEVDLRKTLPELPVVTPTTPVDLAQYNAYEKQMPKMNIVVMIVGSRGDVQPYVALAKRLLKDGHRVRIATHGSFRSFVTDNGVEFFDIGGDPHDLMSYMVKNPGLIPGIKSLRNGDIKRKRKMLSEMIHGCWRACISPCPETKKHFLADAIISNPPAFAHVHCAEALGIPLLMSFTMPWTTTSSFPHPLVNIKRSNAERRLTNYLSYHLAELLTWQGLGDLINDFRMETLGLEPLTVKSGPGILETLRVPWTYCMSPALVPKPADWPQEIDVTGFYFLDLATNYSPPPDLAQFLADGPPPIYVGFGSVVVDDATAMTNTIFEATRQAGVRALVSAGWGGLGGVSVPPHIFILGNIPHDWLFANGRVAAVVHHGGAGTTAAGLSKGLPTVVVPFFGDQGFWGSMIEKAGAGPTPIAPKALAVDTLTDAIRFVMGHSARTAAQKLADKIHNEDGVNRGALSFYRHMPLDNMRCDLDPSRSAVWWSKKYCLRLSCFAAQALADSGQVDIDSLRLYATRDGSTYVQAKNPVSGATNAALWSVGETSSAIAEIFYSPVSGLRRTAALFPGATVKVLTGVSEGFQNVPDMYGGHTRKSKKITGIGSGFKEGGKAFALGVYDGVADLFLEPIRGGQKDGALGVLKGSARGVANFGMRPFAGMTGLVAHPLQGIWTSIKLDAAHKNAKIRRAARIQQGKDEVAGSTSDERWKIVKAFNSSMPALHQRRQLYELTKHGGDRKGKGKASDTEFSSSQASPRSSRAGSLSSTSSTPGLGTRRGSCPPAYSPTLPHHSQ